MTLRFWRRIRIAPGLRVNLSKSGASVSIGRRGGWYTIGPRGQRMTVGAPGTGFFWTEHSRAPQPGRAARVAGMNRDCRDLGPVHDRDVVACYPQLTVKI
jgi:hypothetical protein